jgi:hypothetical protein
MRPATFVSYDVLEPDAAHRSTKGGSRPIRRRLSHRETLKARVATPPWKVRLSLKQGVARPRYLRRWNRAGPRDPKRRMARDARVWRSLECQTVGSRAGGGAADKTAPGSGSLEVPRLLASTGTLPHWASGQTGE